VQKTTCSMHMSNCGSGAKGEVCGSKQLGADIDCQDEIQEAEEPAAKSSAATAISAGPGAASRHCCSLNSL
jgi:hypothetical protein